MQQMCAVSKIDLVVQKMSSYLMKRWDSQGDELQRRVVQLTPHYERAPALTVISKPNGQGEIGLKLGNYGVGN